ncbi:MAG: ornithine carbamoyltransferase [Candidatus Micrarchaeia archaeon]
MPSLISITDVDSKTFIGIVNKALEYKRTLRNPKAPKPLAGKFIALFFEKPSTRTRSSFEIAAESMGAKAIYLPSSELQTSRGEPVKDVARMFSGWFDAIVARVRKHETLEELAQYSGLPVINALSDIEHPTQVISDFMTLLEVKKRLKGLKLAFIGDANNVARSLALGSALVGMDFAIATPKGYSFDSATISRAEELAKASGSEIIMTNSPAEAAEGADVLYTDVWVSMGQETEARKRMHDFKNFQINAALLKLAKSDAVVMHCLPAHRGLEITEQVLEGKQSVAWLQGRNKLYGAASALAFALDKRR